VVGAVAIRRNVADGVAAANLAGNPLADPEQLARRAVRALEAGWAA